MLTYPSSLPTDALDDLITNIEHFTVLQNRQQLLLDAWNIQGYLQGLVFGVPTPPPASNAVAAHEKAIAAFKTLKASRNAASVAMIDWQSILNWIIAVIQALLQGVVPPGLLPTRAA